MLRCQLDALLGFLCGVVCVILQYVFVELQVVTDRRTDGQTDMHDVSKYGARKGRAGKNN